MGARQVVVNEQIDCLASDPMLLGDFSAYVS